MKKDIKIIQSIRKLIIEKSFYAKSSHIGSCLSIVEILYCIYFLIKKKNDIFILSKGHAALALYVILYLKNKITRKTLDTYGKNNTILMSHTSHKVNGVEFSTGSLGHGIPYGVGKALYFKKNKIKKRVIVLISDGELDEGTTWESLLFASHHKLNNLKIIIDYNKIQSLDYVKNVIKVEPLNKKLLSFGANVINCDGHNVNKLKLALNKKSSKPTVIVANTVKGKGVSFMENDNLWHYKSPSYDEMKKALIELSK